MLPIGGSSSQETSECQDFAVDEFRLLVGVDDHHLGVAGNRRRRRMHVQLAEAAAERHLLLVVHLLVAEEDHEVLHQRVVHFLEDLVSHRLRQVDAEDLGADHRRHLADLDRLVGHRLLLIAACPMPAPCAAR